MPPLQCARHDNALAAELLIARGLSVDQQDDDLWTPLHMACACRSSDTVLLLLTVSTVLLLSFSSIVCQCPLTAHESLLSRICLVDSRLNVLKALLSIVNICHILWEETLLLW